MEKNLTYFYGIGPIQAKKIANELRNNGVDNNASLTELRKQLRKIKDALPDLTKIDLEYNPLRVIPRSIITYLDEKFHYLIPIKFDVAGSYIRGKNTSGDIDIVVSTDEHKENTWDYFMNTINNNSKTIRFHPPFSEGPDKIGVLIEVDLEKSHLIKINPDLKKLCKTNRSSKVNVKADIFLSSSEDYIYALLFAIGSGKFNIRMRAVAKRKGYLLNNHGLFKKENNHLTKVKINSEKEIFEKLGMHYRLPKDRTA